MKNLLYTWNQLKPFTKGLVLFATFNIFFVNVVLIALSLKFLFPTYLGSTGMYQNWEDVGIYHTVVQFFTFSQKSDSWGPMRAALRLHETGSPIYDIFFKQRVKFQYPPSSLLINMFLRRSLYLNIISWLSIVVTVLFSLKIFEVYFKKSKEQYSSNYSKLDLRIITVTLCCLGLTFYPIIKGYSLGQVQAILNALFAVTFWCWITGRKQFSGFFLGLMCLIKPQYAVFLLWGVFRKQWKFLTPFLITLSSGLLLSISIFGFSNHLAYLQVLSFLSKHGEALFANQSVNGILNRLLFNGSNLIWSSKNFAPYNPLIYFGTLITSLTFLVTALIPYKKREEAGFVDFSIIALTATIASPIAWEHHYGILLPIYAALLPYLLENPFFGKSTLIYLGISYFLTSNLLKFMNLLAPIPVLNILQSYLFGGALIVLVCLHLLKKRRSFQSISDKPATSFEGGY